MNGQIKRFFLIMVFVWSILITAPYLAKGNIAEREDDIVCTIFYGWWGNDIYRQSVGRGGWEHWGSYEHQPPKTWASCYIPNYPDSTFNPAVQLYDSEDTEVLRRQDRNMALTGIDIVASSWWVPNDSTDRTLAKAIRMCKSVQWCIYYEPEGYGDPSPQKIYSDIKYVIDSYGPSKNYAKVDGKWLVFVYRAREEDAANRWREAKKKLSADEYNIFLVGAVTNLTQNHPWDAVYQHQTKVHRGFSNTDVDDSAWVSPGQWGWKPEKQRLERSLSEFISAWNQTLIHKEEYRFVVIETWNQWRAGTQIEPGQEIVRDLEGYYPSGEDNYDYDFIDAIGPTAISELRWTSSGHRPSPPVHSKASDLIWEDGSYADPEDPNACIIPEEYIRIGSSVSVQEPSDLFLTVQAKHLPPTMPPRGPNPQTLLLYFNDEVAAVFEVGSGYQEYSVVFPVYKGIHKLEIGPGKPAIYAGTLVVDYLDVAADPNYYLMGGLFESFETSNFEMLEWRLSGDADWDITSENSHSGTYSAKAGSIGDNEITSLETTLDCVAGDISFYRKVSSEDGCDHLMFYIDGSKKGSWSGEQDWAQTSYPVTGGRRNFRWTFSKDSSVSEGYDTAWIDDIVFPVE